MPSFDPRKNITQLGARARRNHGKRSPKICILKYNPGRGTVDMEVPNTKSYSRNPFMSELREKIQKQIPIMKPNGKNGKLSRTALTKFWGTKGKVAGKKVATYRGRNGKVYLQKKDFRKKVKQVFSESRTIPQIYAITKARNVLNEVYSTGPGKLPVYLQSCSNLNGSARTDCIKGVRSYYKDYREEKRNFERNEANRLREERIKLYKNYTGKRTKLNDGDYLRRSQLLKSKRPIVYPTGRPNTSSQQTMTEIYLPPEPSIPQAPPLPPQYVPKQLPFRVRGKISPPSTASIPKAPALFLQPYVPPKLNIRTKTRTPGSNLSPAFKPIALEEPWRPIELEEYPSVTPWKPVQLEEYPTYSGQSIPRLAPPSASGRSRKRKLTQPEQEFNPRGISSNSSLPPSDWFRNELPPHSFPSRFEFPTVPPPRITSVGGTNESYYAPLPAKIGVPDFSKYAYTGPKSSTNPSGSLIPSDENGLPVRFPYIEPRPQNPNLFPPGFNASAPSGLSEITPLLPPPGTINLSQGRGPVIEQVKLTPVTRPVTMTVLKPQSAVTVKQRFASK